MLKQKAKEDEIEYQYLLGKISTRMVTAVIGSASSINIY